MDPAVVGPGLVAGLFIVASCAASAMAGWTACAVRAALTAEPFDCWAALEDEDSRVAALRDMPPAVLAALSRDAAHEMVRLGGAVHAEPLRCLICRCSNQRACAGGCSWLAIGQMPASGRRVGICSQCSEGASVHEAAQFARRILGRAGAIMITPPIMISGLEPDHQLSSFSMQER